MSEPERCPQGTCYTTYSRLHPYRKDVQHARTNHCAYWRELIADTAPAEPHVCKPSCHNPCLLDDEKPKRAVADTERENKAASETAALRQDLLNLLAVIHRDGGQYADEHGTHKASEDAEAIVVALRQRVEEMERFTRQVSKSMDRTGSYSYVHERIVAEARRLLEGSEKND